MICIYPPYEQTSYDYAKRALFEMEVNVRRMKYMMNNGYYISEYSDEEWRKFF